MCRGPVVLALLLCSLCGCQGCARPPGSLPPTAAIPAPQPLSTPLGAGGPQFPSGAPVANAAPVVRPGNEAWRPASAPRNWQYIVLHHTATETGSVDSIHAAHQQKKDKSGKPWLGIGYHFVIGNGRGMPDGAVEPTFRWRTQIQGAHAGSSNRDYNEVGIGVCLVGNFEETPPTPAQVESCHVLVQTLRREFQIAETQVVPHNEIRTSGTACPGKLFPLSTVASDSPVTLLGVDAQGVPVSSFTATLGRTLR